MVAGTLQYETHRTSTAYLRVVLVVELWNIALAVLCTYRKPSKAEQPGKGEVEESHRGVLSA